MGWIIFILIIVIITIFIWLTIKGSSGGGDIHGQPPDAGDLGGT
ncbi:MAG: hypothetical protein U9P90_02600 [Patescibacteria group bacterium]|nr:hypothetical protein [Patescibacteria group bacterium]